MNIFSTTSGELSSLPAGTYFVIGTLQLNLSVLSGESENQVVFVTGTLVSPSGDINTVTTGEIVQGLTTGYISVTIQGVVVLSSSGNISISYSLAQEGAETIFASVGASQLQALQLQCETLTTD